MTQISRVCGLPGPGLADLHLNQVGSPKFHENNTNDLLGAIKYYYHHLSLTTGDQPEPL